MIEFSKVTLMNEPFDHAVVDGIFDEALYQELSSTFPNCPPASGPTGFTIHRGDPEFDETINNHPAWRRLYKYCNSGHFVESIATLFQSEIDRACDTPKGIFRYADHIETRAEKELDTIRHSPLKARDLFVRFDFMQGRENYGRQKHLDHSRRLATMLLYFDAPGPGWFEGGSLVLHDANDAAAVSIEPSQNRGVFFACTEKSWHSVRPVTNSVAPRRLVQVSISSTHDLWKRSSNPSARLAARVKSVIFALRPNLGLRRLLASR